MDSIADCAENTLESKVYWGERGRYRFETHVCIHQNTHHNIQLATGMEMSGRDKVQKLLNLITALNIYRTDFDMVVNYLMNFVEDSPSEHRNMSSMQLNDSEAKVNSKGAKLTVEARFYDPSEWAKMSPNEQCKACDLQVEHAKAQQKHKMAQVKVRRNDKKPDK